MISPETSESNPSEQTATDPVNGGYETPEEEEAARRQYAVNPEGQEDTLRGNYEKMLDSILDQVTDAEDRKGVELAILRFISSGTQGATGLFTDPKKMTQLAFVAQNFPGGQMSNLYQYLDRRFNQSTGSTGTTSGFEDETTIEDGDLSEEELEELAEIERVLDRRNESDKEVTSEEEQLV